jgi:hypothetical protein
MYCHDCMYALCSDCNLAVHKNSAKRAHVPVPVSESKNLKNLSTKCTVKGHEEYRLEFYCTRCEVLCCAYCLQIGPHLQHESALVTKAALDVRMQMGQDLENLGQVKARLEGMANELNRVYGQYHETYDHVESLISDRFNAFRQQLQQKEVEVRKIFLNLQQMGDHSLAESREQYLRKINSLNTAGMSFRRLQRGGADYEVLQNRSTMQAFLKIDVPTVTGTGFRLSDMGDLNLSGLAISLDLASSLDQMNAMMVGGGQPQLSSTALRPSPSVHNSRSASEVNSVRPVAGGASRAPMRLTFDQERDMDMRDTSEGLVLSCSRGAPEQIGVRSVESFDSLRPHWQADGGVVTWRMRLDNVAETFLGVIDANPAGDQPDGFHWQPARQGHYDGTVGRVTHVLRGVAACRSGDTVRFTYDTAAKTLRLAVNNADRGVVLTDVPSTLAPCFIFSPGETVTLLY